MSATSEFDNGHQYTAIVGELIADFIAFGRQVEGNRPEIGLLPGTYHLTIDAAAGVVMLAKALTTGQVVLVERVLANPKSPQTFGASELPIVFDEAEIN